ncbi:hypothetical protein J6590_013595 [Homalodisca vitripennis]|nr:hypothetical protein J6590_013595 [Homalodisca vitripennis]
MSDDQEKDLYAKVAWIKSDSKAILAIHTHLVAHNNRLSVTHNGHNTWKLMVSNVQKNDSGTYMCQINTDPMRSQMGYLEVVIPPDILNENGPDDYVAVEGGSVRVRCKATGVPEPTVLWRREDSQSIVLRTEATREKQGSKCVMGMEYRSQQSSGDERTHRVSFFELRPLEGNRVRS